MAEADFTSYQKVAIWEIITDMNLCPYCGAKGLMLTGPRGGMAMNIKCKECQTVFWISPFKAFGAYPINASKEVITKCLTT